MNMNMDINRECEFTWNAETLHMYTDMDTLYNTNMNTEMDMDMQ